MMARFTSTTRLRLPSREGLRWRAGNAAEKASFAQREARETLRTMMARARRASDHQPTAALGAVVVGRNDGYIPDFFKCLHTTIRLNAIRAPLSEVVFVEWAPPADTPLLAPELTRRLPFVTAYVVPEEIQGRSWGDRSGDFLEYHAKNVGIRRATTPWVVVTNADILFGGDTARALRHLPADSRSVGLAQRYNVPWEPGSRLSAGKRLRFERAIPFHEYGTGDFVLAHRDLWRQAAGYDEGIPELRAGCDVRGVGQLETHGGLRRRVGCVLHVQHDTSITERVSRGEDYQAADRRGLPYRNPDSWGLSDCATEEIAPRVFRLKAG